MRTTLSVIGALGITAMTLPALADVATLSASKDNSIFESETPLSNGQGEDLFTGRNGVRGGGIILRSLIAFDLSGIPANATVTSAALTLNVHRASAFGVTETYNLYRLTADWGEGTSVAFGGSGGEATPGDCTWNDTFFPDSHWTVPGGDFVQTSSAATAVPAILGPVTWGSTAGLVADVQQWVQHPETNFGWIIRGNETQPQTARTFASREAFEVDQRPVLVVEIQVGPPPCAADWNHDNSLNSQDFFDFLTSFFAANADFNHDQATNSQDFFDFITAFFAGC